MHNPTARLETFCDGVFAIAITLLILEIKVPLLDTINSDHTLLQALIAQWPSWLALLLSFGTILIAWSNHHGSLKLVDKSSGLFTFTNGFLLLTIVILPYPTSLLAEFVNTSSVNVVVMFYAFTIVLQNMSWTLLYHSMLHPRDLSRNEHAKSTIIKTRQQCIYAFFIYLSINVIAYWQPYIALTLMGLLWLVWIYVAITLNQDNEDSPSSKA
jgi:uncharacterized membrane protein